MFCDEPPFKGKKSASFCHKANAFWSRSHKILNVIEYNHLLLANLDEYQPTEVPAAGAGWIFNDQRLGFIEAFRAKWIVSRQATKLTEKIIGIDVISPSAFQRLHDFGRINVC